MADLLCYGEAEFNRIMRERGWTTAKKLPRNVAVISICTPFNTSVDDDWKHFFEHNNKNVYNLNIEDIDPIQFRDEFNEPVVEWRPDYFIYKKNGKDLHIFNPDEAYGLACFIRANAGMNFYIHCALGLSRIQGIVNYILKTYPEFYDQRSLNQKNLPGELANKWVEYLLTKWSIK